MLKFICLVSALSFWPCYGREPLQTDVGKTDCRRCATKIHRATGSNGQRCKPPVRFQQSQIIGRIHLNYFCVNQTRAREQTNLRPILDDVVVRNQITIVRDEKASAAGHGPSNDEKLLKIKEAEQFPF